MKKLDVSMNTPGRKTVLAALLAGLALSAGAVPSVPNHLVISQVYGGGGNGAASTGFALYKNDFVELFNPTGAAVNVTGWSVQYSPGSNTNWTGSATLSGSIEPGKYMLVKLASGGSNGADLPSADSTGTYNMSATSGKVALSKSAVNLSIVPPTSADLVDWVGFGGANFAEGTVTPAPSGTATNTKSLFRADGGCSDTDNNLSDFSLGAPNPRNSATPALSCGAAPAAAIVPSCPASLSFEAGTGAFAALSATDSDSTVNGASITSGAISGITLGSLTPASGVGGTASVNLNADATLVNGTYPVVITFTNDAAQSATCSVDIKVAGTHTIPQIQGAGATSPLNNTVQTTSGVITMIAGNGFFMQDPNGDGDPSTSDGIFVFGALAAGAAAVGDLVTVKGTVTEFTPGGGNRSITEIKDYAILAKSPGGAIVPTNIEMPGNGLAQYESMLVRITNPLTVNDTGMLGERGELSLSSGRREIPTNHYPAGSAGALAMAAANAANRIVLDDRLTVTPNPIPYIGEGSTVRSGDTVTDLVGVIDYASIGNSDANFKLQPLPDAPPTFSRTNARTPAPVVPAGNVKVASANVLNFFTTFTNGADVFGHAINTQGCLLGSSTSKSNCRGADDLDEFVRQRDKIVDELKAIDADVVGLMEIQNNGDTAVSHLVDKLNESIGFTTYAYVPMPPATGTDAIRVAMIYKPAAVSLVGAALSDNNGINNRPPMAQTFKVASNGAKFSVIVNHLKSKSSCPSGTGVNTDHGDSQGCWNGTRIQQAQQLAGVFIPQVVSTSGDPDVLVIGDMNSHGFEDPINVLTGAGLVNELERFVRPNGLVYSYVFDGESGYLDHALATASLDSQMAGATEWHNNADEPEVIDYNKNLGSTSGAKPQDLYLNNAYRASDHDPVVVSLNLTPTFVDATSSFKIAQSGLSVNRFTLKYTGTVSFTNNSAATISGPIHFQLDGLTAGVTLDNKTGDHGGAPYITLNAASIAPGATVTVTTTFSNPSKLSIVYTPKIFSGTF